MGHWKRTGQRAVIKCKFCDEDMSHYKDYPTLDMNPPLYTDDYRCKNGHILTLERQGDQSKEIWQEVEARHE
jgi:hypothetical protein